eukprot:5516355-Amphidinium_carterae.1
MSLHSELCTWSLLVSAIDVWLAMHRLTQGSRKSLMTFIVFFCIGNGATEVSSALDCELLLDSLDSLVKEEKWICEASYDKVARCLPMRVRTDTGFTR